MFSAFYKEDGKTKQEFRLKEAITEKKISQSEYYYIYRNGFSAYCRNRIYLRDKVAGKIRFDENISVGEDVIFNIEYQKTCDGFLYVDKPLYHWVDNGNDSLFSTCRCCCRKGFAGILHRLSESFLRLYRCCKR